MVHDYKLQSLDKFTVKIFISSNQEWNMLAYDGAFINPDIFVPYQIVCTIEAVR